DEEVFEPMAKLHPYLEDLRQTRKSLNDLGRFGSYLGKDGFKIQVFLTPGHSPGSVCLYLPDTKVLITGDVIFFMSVGRTDFPGGSTILLKESIDKISQLDVEYLVPGHNTEPNGIIQGKDRIKRNFAAVQEYF
ncbi:MAG: MBL fold metallo-hydrolase, partial [Dehalococcoidia bacterium]